MTEDIKLALIIIGGVVVVTFIITAGIVIGHAVGDSSYTARYKACETAPLSKRADCINQSHPTGGVAAVNACNTATANWEATFPNANSFPYWQDCMKDVLAGKSFTAPKPKGKS